MDPLNPIKSHALVVYSPQKHTSAKAASRKAASQRTPPHKAASHMEKMQYLASASFRAQIADHLHFHSAAETSHLRQITIPARYLDELLGTPQSSLIIVTIDLSKHDFLERRVGGKVLSSAHDVANSLNKDIIRVAPLDKERTAELEQEFTATLPSYGTIQNELLLITKVLNEKIGIKNFVIKEFSEGGSGAKVFGVFVPDNKGKLAYVIKTMEGRPSELARELSSLQQLSDLNLHQSTLPTAQTAGKFDLQQNKTVHTVFVQTAAPGKPFSALLEDVGKASGKERGEKIEALKNGFIKAARGLAELHLKNQHLATPVGKEARAFNLETLDDVYKICITLSESGEIPMKKEELETIYKSIREAVVDNWGLSGYSHGDSHLDNLFFDSSSSQFSFIDTPSFLASIDEHGKPIGFPAYDFAWTFDSISGKGFLSGLSEAEVVSLQRVFKKEYDRAMGESLPSQPAQNFAALTKKFYFIQYARGLQQYILDNPSKFPDAQEKIQRLQKLLDHEIESVRKLVDKAK